MRRIFAVLVFLGLAAPHAAVLADDRPPTIVTYEQKRQHDDERAAASDPKAFWVHQIVAGIEATVPHPKIKTKGPLTVRLGFVVGRDGHLVSKAVQVSSGNPELDQLALGMVERAQPFPPMPESVDSQQIAFVLPIRFR